MGLPRGQQRSGSPGEQRTRAGCQMQTSAAGNRLIVGLVLCAHCKPEPLTSQIDNTVHEPEKQNVVLARTSQGATMNGHLRERQ
jgi:hypothetical protein